VEHVVARQDQTARRIERSGHDSDLKEQSGKNHCVPDLTGEISVVRL